MSDDKIEVLKLAHISHHKDEALLIIEIISAWSIIEDSLAGVLSIWSEIDPRQAHLFLAWISGKSRLDAVRAAGEFFLKQNAPTLIDELNKTFKVLGQRFHCRNKYAHGRYQESSDGKLFLINRTTETYEILYVSSLKNELGHFRNALDQLENLRVKSFSLLPTPRMKTLLEKWSQPTPLPSPNKE